MARPLFKSTDLGGPDADPAELYRIYAPHWELVLLCEKAGLYRREGQVLIGWVMDLTFSEIATLADMRLPHVGRTWKSALERIAPFLGPKAGSSSIQAAHILMAFRNRKTRAGHGDHGPTLGETRHGAIREMTATTLVLVEDLTRERWADVDPAADDLLRRLALD